MVVTRSVAPHRPGARLCVTWRANGRARSIVDGVEFLTVTAMAREAQRGGGVTMVGEEHTKLSL